MAQTYANFVQAQQQLANIEAIDYFFAKEMVTAITISSKTTSHTALSSENLSVLTHILIALSVSLRAGHTCLPLPDIANTHWALNYDEQGQCSHQGYVFSDLAGLQSLLADFELSPSAQHPVVYLNNMLYIRRYFEFEQQLTHAINTRLTLQTTSSVQEVSDIINQLFPDEKTTQEIDWQKIAVANAMNKYFTVIAGGPGTGKTYTVTKLLAALLMLDKNSQTNADNNPIEIALVAPTGKAAQRLSESIIKAIVGFKGLIADDILLSMPTLAKTIHRLLGVIPNSPNFRHNQDNLLSCDVLLIDEVSMVDLPMMTRIMRALKPKAKVILLGDADQLPSVAVGSVLANIAPRPHSGYSQNNLTYLSKACQIEVTQLQQPFIATKLSNNNPFDHLSFLTKSRRFDGEGGIGKLATQVIHGEASKSWHLLTASINSDSSQLTLVDNNLTTWLMPLVTQYYQGIAQCDEIVDAFALLAKFRILCVTRQGEFGVDLINQRIKDQLVKGYNADQASYHGMPIMINENDYRLGLFNGDIGLLWRTEDGHLMAFFETSELDSVQGNKVYKTLLPSRLPKYDAVYAMTIHKTQGSEFDHVAIVLPKQAEHQLLSRELLYTGITRAKEKLTIASNQKTWKFSVQTAIKRYSGLML